MSNHSGSYMLNSLLTMIERESFFSDIGPEYEEMPRSMPIGSLPTSASYPAAPDAPTRPRTLLEPAEAIPADAGAGLHRPLPACSPCRAGCGCCVEAPFRSS